MARGRGDSTWQEEEARDRRPRRRKKRPGRRGVVIGLVAGGLALAALLVVLVVLLTRGEEVKGAAADLSPDRNNRLRTSQDLEDITRELGPGRPVKLAELPKNRSYYYNLLLLGARQDEQDQGVTTWYLWEGNDVVLLVGTTPRPGGERVRFFGSYFGTPGREGTQVNRP